LSRACTVAWMPRANGPECGTKRILGLDARGGLGERGDLRRVAMAERAVRIEVAVPRRVMRAFDGLAARAGAARDAADEQRGLDAARRSSGTLASRMAVEKQPGGRRAAWSPSSDARARRR
jgi:hypothetical protein